MLMEKSVQHTFEDEPIVARHSNMFGELRIYAPCVPVSEWSISPFLFKTQHGDKGLDSPGLEHLVRPDALQYVLNHTAIIMPYHLWTAGDFSKSP